MQIVYIEWLDSHTSGPWKHFDDVSPTRLICKTVGWLLHEDKDIKIVAGNTADFGNGANAQGSCYTHIPTATITRFERLSAPKAKRRRRA